MLRDKFFLTLFFVLIFVATLYAVDISVRGAFGGARSKVAKFKTEFEKAREGTGNADALTNAANELRAVARKPEVGAVLDKASETLDAKAAPPMATTSEESLTAARKEGRDLLYTYRNRGRKPEDLQALQEFVTQNEGATDKVFTVTVTLAQVVVLQSPSYLA